MKAIENLKFVLLRCSELFISYAKKSDERKISRMGKYTLTKKKFVYTGEVKLGKVIFSLNEISVYIGFTNLLIRFL